MQRRAFRIGEDPAAAPGAVLCRDVSLRSPDGPVTLRRGTALDEALARLPAGGEVPALQIVVPTGGDIPQPEASLALAQRIAGEGVDLAGPHQGQVTLRAARDGLLRVRGDAVARLNRSRVALVATAFDGRVVAAGDDAGIVKAPELFIREAALQQALGRLAPGPVAWVAPFTVRRAAVIAGERIRPANLDVSTPHLAASLRRFGADLVAVRHISDRSDEIAATYRDLLDQGVEVLLVAGSIVLDPRDPFLLALRPVGARLVRRGAPIEPGTMFWVAYAGDVPILGLASCEMYGRLSILDLVLPYALAREPITRDLLATLGYGGLLHATQTARGRRDAGSSGRPPDSGEKP